MNRALVATVIASLALVGGAAARPSAQTLDGCLRAGSGTEVVHLRSSEGATISAGVLGRGADGVVLSNQSDRDLCSWLPFARSLERLGYRVLVYDYASRRPWADTEAAASELHRLGSRRVFLVGASEGAKASILAAAARATRIAAVVSISAERSFLGGPDVTPSVAKLRVPVLFLFARNDPYSQTDTPALYRACNSHTKRLVTLPGFAHGLDLLSGSTGSRARAAITAFLAARS